jgi:hypothetical protein
METTIRPKPTSVPAPSAGTTPAPAEPTPAARFLSKYGDDLRQLGAASVTANTPTYVTATFDKSRDLHTYVLAARGLRQSVEGVNLVVADEHGKLAPAEWDRGWGVPVDNEPFAPVQDYARAIERISAVRDSAVLLGGSMPSPYPINNLRQWVSVKTGTAEDAERLSTLFEGRLRNVPNANIALSFAAAKN